MWCIQGQRARGAGAQAAQDQSKCPNARNRHSASILSNMIMYLVPCICSKDGAPIDYEPHLEQFDSARNLNSHYAKCSGQHL
jgi:hypothetical protein